MPVAFSGSELLNIAIGIERQGAAYYDVMARSMGEAVARELFRRLAEMERGHIELFQKLLADIPRGESVSQSGGEDADYTQSLINSAVFTDDMLDGPAATHLDSVPEALGVAIGAEKDAILFYYNMREILPASVVPLVGKVIAEEKSHLGWLTALRKQITK